MKYRLIKEYPGSPRLGFVVYEQEKDLWISGTCEQFTKCDINTIKNFPEFWEPVDELEEKILKIIKMKELLEDVLLVLNSIPDRKLRGKDWTTYELAKRVEEKLKLLPDIEKLKLALAEIQQLQKEIKELENETKS